MVNQDAGPVLMLASGTLSVYVLGQPQQERPSHRAAGGSPLHSQPRQVEWQVEACDYRAAAVRPREEDKADELRAAQQPPGGPLAPEAIQLRVLPERRIARGVSLG